MTHKGWQEDPVPMTMRERLLDDLVLWPEGQAEVIRLYAIETALSGPITSEAATLALARAMHVARGAYGEFGVEGDCECLADAEAWLDGPAPEDDRTFAHFNGVAEFEK